MTKEIFIAKYLDETVGLLLAAFSQSEQTQHKSSADHWAADGRFMMEQMRRARTMLGKMYDDLQTKPQEKKI